MVSEKKANAYFGGNPHVGKPSPQIYFMNLEWDSNRFNSNQMEDQIGTVLHWSHQKEAKQAKSKDGVIRWNLDR